LFSFSRYYVSVLGSGISVTANDTAPQTFEVVIPDDTTPDEYWILATDSSYTPAGCIPGENVNGDFGVR